MLFLKLTRGPQRLLQLLALALALSAPCLPCQLAGEAGPGPEAGLAPGPGSVGASAASAAAAATTTTAALHQELLVQPHSQVRIECRLPQLAASQQRSYYWYFQRTATNAAKPYYLCLEAKCLKESFFGYQLEMDRETGAYDLLIHNVTYELNDGLYYCDYEDSSPDSKQTINREYRLTVLIPPQAPEIAAASQPAREGQEFALTCSSQGGNPEPQVSWFRNDQALVAGSQPGMRLEQARNASTTTSSLSWLPSVDDHQATYRCQVWNKAMGQLQAFEREFKLRVEYAPRITLGPHNPLRVLQGGSVQLACQVDANPAVKTVRWLRDGQPLSSLFNLSLHELKASDSGLYACQADNGIAPLNGQPSHGGHNHHALGPAASLMSLFSLQGSNQASDSKSASAAEAHLQLQVLYGPRVQVRASKSAALAEGDFVSLNCTVDAWPLAHEIVWTRSDDANFRRVSSPAAPYLDFQSVSAADQANYTCTAYNRLEPSLATSSGPLDRQGSASVQLLVRHKPGLAEIQLGQAGETELAAKTLLQCRARPPGYPEPHYKFWKYAAGSQQRLSLSKQAAHGNSYTIYSAKPDDEARYGCVAVNELGTSSEAEGELLVNEPPTVVHDTSARRDEDARAPGDFPYSITVRASGKPEPRVAWFHRSPIDGRRYELSASDLSSRYKIETISKPEHSHQQANANQQRHLKHNLLTTLTFRGPLDKDDRGLYSVEFTNGLSRQAVEQFQLHINHVPVAAPRGLPLTGAAASAAAVRVRAGFELGESVNLTCRVSAYPKPEFLWYSSSAPDADKPIESNSRYRTSVSNPRDDIWESVLSFGQAQESDYGDYMCVTANHDQQTNRISDSVQILVNLSRKSSPEPPSQLEAVDAGSDSVTLAWTSGFDGGFAYNQYVVQYAPDESSRQAPASGSSAAGSASSEEATKSGSARLFDCAGSNPCTVSGLLAKQAYLFRVRAKNELGYSDYSDELRASTRANLSQIPRIVEAAFDSSQNVLHFRVEPNTDYLLSSLNARVELRGRQSNHVMASSSSNSFQADANPDLGADEWRSLPSTLVPVRHERTQAYLNTSAEVEHLRLTLCSRGNESLCGPELVVSMRSATSSFLHEQRAMSPTTMAGALSCLLLFSALALASAHSCRLAAKRNNKAAKLAAADGPNSGALDNKPAAPSDSSGPNSASGSQATMLGSGQQSSNGGGGGGVANPLASLDSMNGAGTGSASDRSSDHSRQAKLDSMLPPNYNHYADRATLMLEQQQLQQQLQHQQQLALVPEQLNPPVGGQPTPFTLLGLANSKPAVPSPPAHFSIYGNQATLASQQHQLEEQQHQQQQQQQMLDPMLAYSDAWAQANHAQLANVDYNNYNAYADQQQQHQQLIDTSTYGVSAGPQNGSGSAAMLVAQHAAAYDNSANSSAQQSLGAYMAGAYGQQQQQQLLDEQQHADHAFGLGPNRAQYQQEVAVAQHQLYGTLKRQSASQLAAAYAMGVPGDTGGQEGAGSQQLEQQQQSGQQQQQHLYAHNGLANGPQQPNESDYGTLGGRSGRLIREIIV